MLKLSACFHIYLSSPMSSSDAIQNKTTLRDYIDRVFFTFLTPDFVPIAPKKPAAPSCLLGTHLNSSAALGINEGDK